MWLFGHNQWDRSRSPKMRGIALVIGRAGASPPSRATGAIFLYISVRRVPRYRIYTILLQRYAHAHIHLSPVFGPEFVYSIYLPLKAIGSVLFVYDGNDAFAKASSLQAQRSHVLRTFSPLLTHQMPVLFPQTTILALGRCQPLLNDSLYGHLHMKQPRYAFSRSILRPYIKYNGRVALLHTERAVFAMYDMDYCHKTRQGTWLLGHSQWGRSRSPKNA